MQPLYNREGRAIAYIADNGISIYLYDGEAAGWVYQDSLVFAYSGKFLGWLMYGWLCDPAGNPAFFTDRSSGGPKRPARLARPIRASRDSRPARRQRQVRPSRPGMTNVWSAHSDESFFAAPPAPEGAVLDEDLDGEIGTVTGPAKPGTGDVQAAIGAASDSPPATAPAIQETEPRASEPPAVNDPAEATDPPAASEPPEATDPSEPKS